MRPWGGHHVHRSGSGHRHRLRTRCAIAPAGSRRSGQQQTRACPASRRSGPITDSQPPSRPCYRVCGARHAGALLPSELRAGRPVWVGLLFFSRDRGQSWGYIAHNFTLEGPCLLLLPDRFNLHKNGWMHIHMSTSKQLLIVDDDREIRELLNEYLTRRAFRY